MHVSNLNIRINNVFHLHIYYISLNNSSIPLLILSILFHIFFPLSFLYDQISIFLPYLFFSFILNQNKSYQKIYYPKYILLQFLVRYKLNVNIILINNNTYLNIYNISLIFAYFIPTRNYVFFLFQNFQNKKQLSLNYLKSSKLNLIFHKLF